MSAGEAAFLIVQLIVTVAVALLADWNKRRLERRFWNGLRRHRTRGSRRPL